MGYSFYEQSLHLGEPVELYHFVRGTQEWNYAKGHTQVTHLGDVYTPLEIQRTAPRQGTSDAPGTVEVTLPADSALGALLQQGGNVRTIDVTIFSYHRPIAASTRIIFLGEITQANVQPDVVVVTCSPLAGLLQQQIPRGTMQRDRCIWTTYHPGTCDVDPANFTFAGTVAAVSGNQLQITVTGASAFVPGLPGSVARADMFVKGSLRKGEQQSEIEAQVGDIMHLSERMPGLIVGDSVSLLAGDDHQPSTCVGKFQNGERMMVHPHMPQINVWYGQGMRRR